MAKRLQQKLVLLDEEIRLIKGIMEYIDKEDINDQMIVSIFSHKSRTINHREIGYIRDTNCDKYRNYPAASKQKVETFLSNYDRFELHTKTYHLQPREECFNLLSKAIEAMKNVISIYNNPNIKWKAETSIVNAIIAWTYLMHSYYMRKGIDYSYKNLNGQPTLINGKNVKYWDLSKCITNEGKCPLAKPIIANLKYLIEIRNEIEHKMSDNIDIYIGGKLQSCAKNFNYSLCQWFGEKYSITDDLLWAIQLGELPLHQELPKSIQVVNALIENNLSDKEYNDPQYSFRVYVVPKITNNRNKADQVVTYAPLGSDIEMAIREVERPKYLPSQIVDKMKKEGFSNFKMHGKEGFVAFWKSMDGKNSAKNLGVNIAGQWYWYERMVEMIRTELQKRQTNECSAPV